MSFGSRGQGSESRGIPKQLSRRSYSTSPVTRIEMEIFKLAAIIWGQGAAPNAILIPQLSTACPNAKPRSDSFFGLEN
jgi:hypothetical protein